MSVPHSPRQERFWNLQDFSRGRGLEIGPLHRPTLVAGEAQVQYADLYTAEHFRKYYQDHPQITTETIPEIDFVLLKDGVAQRLIDATGSSAPYDWIIASHVIEHVPDVIDWLAQAAEITVDHGALILAVPDRRFTFDLHRPTTSVGQFLQAHELRESRPSTRAVYDHFSSHVTVAADHLWAGGTPPGYAARTYQLKQALAAMERRRNGEYVDAHVWMFTPDSFLAQMSELRRLGHSSWFVESIAPTTRNTLEFLVRMRRIPCGADATIDPEGEVLPSGSAPDWVIDQHVAGFTFDSSGSKCASSRNRCADSAAASRPWSPRIVGGSAVRSWCLPVPSFGWCVRCARDPTRGSDPDVAPTGDHPLAGHRRDLCAAHPTRLGVPSAPGIDPTGLPLESDRWGICFTTPTSHGGTATRYACRFHRAAVSAHIARRRSRRRWTKPSSSGSDIRSVYGSATSTNGVARDRCSAEVAAVLDDLATMCGHELGR